VWSIVDLDVDDQVIEIIEHKKYVPDAPPLDFAHTPLPTQCRKKWQQENVRNLSEQNNKGGGAEICHPSQH
jgi:hypothetical protein